MIHTYNQYVIQYYAELFSSEQQLPTYKANNDEEAIKYFQQRYKEDLQAVIKDNDPDIRCIWEA